MTKPMWATIIQENPQLATEIGAAVAGGIGNPAKKRKM
jgi:hypothetical protein